MYSIVCNIPFITVYRIWLVIEEINILLIRQFLTLSSIISIGVLTFSQADILETYRAIAKTFQLQLKCGGLEFTLSDKKIPLL